MRVDFDYLTYLKNKGYVIASGWMLNPKYTVQQILAGFNEGSGKKITQVEFGRILANHNIQQL
jgi:hypothetical protein